MLLIATCTIAAGCATRHAGPRYQTVPGGALRETAEAQALNDQGLAAINRDDRESAERHFRSALERDLYYAPAHNNLGLVLLKTDRYYEAAWEFEYAQRLAPSAVEPRDNLGLLYEEIGRIDRAIDQYEHARTLDPKQLAPMQHLARAYVKAGRADNKTRNLLNELLAIPQDRQWDEWVRGQAIRLGRPPQPDDAPNP
jgi:protein O-GlcNAc transferase